MRRRGSQPWAGGGGGVPGRQLSRRDSRPRRREGRWGREAGGGGGLTKEVLIVLVDIQLQARVLVLPLGSVVLAVIGPVTHGRLLRGEEGIRGGEEPRWARAS